MTLDPHEIELVEEALADPKEGVALLLERAKKIWTTNSRRNQKRKKTHFVFSFNTNRDASIEKMSECLKKEDLKGAVDISWRNIPLLEFNTFSLDDLMIAYSSGVQSICFNIFYCPKILCKAVL